MFRLYIWTYQSAVWLHFHQETLIRESNLNRVRFTIVGSVILIIINPSTAVIH